jgi:hypothetical protein
VDAMNRERILGRHLLLKNNRKIFPAEQIAKPATGCFRYFCLNIIPVLDLFEVISLEVRANQICSDKVEAVIQGSDLVAQPVCASA